MTTLIDALPACSCNNMCDGIGTLPTLAGPHTAASQKLYLIAVTVAVGHGLSYLACRDFLAAANDGSIVRHTKQFAGYMKKGLQERPDMLFFTHPFPVVPGQTVAFTGIHPTE